MVSVIVMKGENEMFRKAQGAVQEFHQVCEYPIGFWPAEMKRPRFEKRITWMMEELGELVSAESFAEQLDALADLAYFLFGTFVEMGIDGSDIFEIVHEANMRKRDSKGATFKHGKTVKPDDWFPPEAKIQAYLDKYGRK